MVMEMTVPCIFATVPVLVMSEGEGDDGNGDGESEGTPPKYMRDVGIFYNDQHMDRGRFGSEQVRVHHRNSPLWR